jgi:hypothetical protein
VPRHPNPSLETSPPYNAPFPQAGIARFPRSPWALILYSNFMIEVQGLQRQGAGLLGSAAKLDPGLVERFAMFVRDQVRRPNTTHG